METCIWSSIFIEMDVLGAGCIDFICWENVFVLLYGYQKDFVGFP